jgi:hypothetical protein
MVNHVRLVVGGPNRVSGLRNGIVEAVMTLCPGPERDLSLADAVKVGVS